MLHIADICVTTFSNQRYEYNLKSNQDGRNAFCTNNCRFSDEPLLALFQSLQTMRFYFLQLKCRQGIMKKGYTLWKSTQIWLDEPSLPRPQEWLFWQATKDNSWKNVFLRSENLEGKPLTDDLTTISCQSFTVWAWAAWWSSTPSPWWSYSNILTINIPLLFWEPLAHWVLVMILNNWRANSWQELHHSVPSLCSPQT